MTPSRSSHSRAPFYFFYFFSFSLFSLYFYSFILTSILLKLLPFHYCHSTLYGPFHCRTPRPSPLINPAFSLTPETQSRKMSGTETATVAAGCFWGVEHLYRKNFGNGKGLLDAKVGYCGGAVSSPSYQAVCSGTTGHAEALRIVFDPSIVTYRQLLEFFYRMHDPTTENRQGPDVGTQYRSAVFTHGDEQQKIAEEITDKVSKQWYKTPLSTKVLPAGQWWDAEEYHQLYLQNNPAGYECPAHFIRPFPPLAD